MAIIRKKELKGMQENELKARLNDLRVEMLRMQTQKSAKAANLKIRETKRTIARILTILTQKSKTNKEKSKTDKEKIQNIAHTKTKTIQKANKEKK
jgi:large subunit ribosomal protein L29